MKEMPNATLIGNLLLFAALLILVYFPALWEQLGLFAFVLWMVVAASGVYLIMYGKGPQD